ncbi:MAG: histidine kinase [Prevotella sp.]|nr:histidine kinase [Prevotella sp.]
MQKDLEIISKRYVWLGIIGALIMVYPNLIYIPWHMEWPCVQEHLWLYWSFHVFRFCYFVLFFILIYRLNTIKAWSLGKRLAYGLGASVVAYGLFALISDSLSDYGVYDRIGTTLILKFVALYGLGATTGHISVLKEEQTRMATEVEQLRAENLQSQYAALAGQINPHFFFNSLSGISSLVRSGDNKRTLDYIDELSDVFRYTLQSSDKGMVPLNDELAFTESFRYVLEVRYAGKLTFDIQVDNQQKTKYMLPVLTLLPIIENVIVHNRIDSAHSMKVSIGINEHGELIVSNPIYPKQQQPVTNGIGLKNLANRLRLMSGRELRVEDDGSRFTVYIPMRN